MFSDDSLVLRWRGVGSRLALTLVFSELQPETLLCVRNPIHGGQWNCELAIAKSANSNGGNLTNPFHHPKIAPWHF
jgi:hypothetical protein